MSNEVTEGKLEQFEKLDDSALIDHILERFHVRHREQFQSLIEKADKVEQVHHDHDACPEGLARQLRLMKDELEQHMFKEENILFPMIRSGQGQMAGGPISVMMHEHDSHAQEIAKLESLAHGLKLPEGACATWTNLYSELHEFIQDLQCHIELENQVLFNRQLAL